LSNLLKQQQQMTDEEEKLSKVCLFVLCLVIFIEIEMGGQSHSEMQKIG
jgi:hypothetical protein